MLDVAIPREILVKEAPDARIAKESRGLVIAEESYSQRRACALMADTSLSDQRVSRELDRLVAIRIRPKDDRQQQRHRNCSRTSS